MRRIRRDEPQVGARNGWEHDRDCREYSTPYGACCCCCELASFLINALVPPTTALGVVAAQPTR